MTRTVSKNRLAILWAATALLAGMAAMGMPEAQAATPMATAAAHAGWHGKRHGWRRGHGLVSGRALNAVGATAQQKTRIHAILKQAATDLKAQRTQARALHARMAGLMTQPTVDANAVESVRQQMQAVRDTVSLRRTQAQVDALAVLTPTQRTQLGAQLAQRQQMMQRHRQEREAAGSARS